ncbi:MAG: hypothetical protein ACRDH7_09235 [Actinomycetota bacterium]
MTWAEAQEAEVTWWGSCLNTFWVEREQFEIARMMGLGVEDYSIRTAGTIWDVGGGPVSMLLKAEGWSEAQVIDPARFPAWTLMRYAEAGIDLVPVPAEDALFDPVLRPDEIWIYNTLQHVGDPLRVVELAVSVAPVVRLFEWVEQMTNECHIHTLHAAEIERWAMDAGGSVSGMSETLDGVDCFHAVIT